MRSLKGPKQNDSRITFWFHTTHSRNFIHSDYLLNLILLRSHGLISIAISFILFDRDYLIIWSLDLLDIIYSRLINFLDPEQSLILRKPSNQFNQSYPSGKAFFNQAIELELSVLDPYNNCENPPSTIITYIKLVLRLLIILIYRLCLPSIVSKEVYNLIYIPNEFEPNN